MQKAYKQLILGMICLFIVMAIGRFAYTPIMPFMQQSSDMNDQSAGILATMNYLGYLIGAIIPIWFIIFTKATDLKIYLIINIVSTIFMGTFNEYTVWIILRLISGITSGAVFVLASNVTLEALRIANKNRISGLLYSGIGVGIFLSSIFIYLYTDKNSWEMTWMILGISSLLLGIFAIVGLKDNNPNKEESQNKEIKQHENSEKLNKRFVFVFSISYFCEGAGYIITGTFLVAIVKAIPDLADYAALSWMFVGLGAIPSAVLWSMMAGKLGHAKAIYLAFVLQIIGVIMPVFLENIPSLVISSLLFGSTFLGLTTLYMSKAQALMFQHNSNLNLVASLTVIYSLGQMIAPAISGLLIGNEGNYDAALIFAAIILTIGLLSSFYSFEKFKNEEKN
ncbi:YbfB/YjiJ family MFS transporter [Staphylococcus caeli]|uniref:Major facilitator superfamily permease n=1 Tax=Staphylococcus caeli TaxID=2201815 RepID=A0A1D4JMC0_9STAP|nr:YbfB/YjiJ family MFS transporter [Staphylococcus caeli]SCS44276.1 major facilitator superfamily permease [Staphylococcus caeli]SCS62970.1 major facilitator superfamily permease [Staphylococcus caeli]